MTGAKKDLRRAAEVMVIVVLCCLGMLLLELNASLSYFLRSCAKTPLFLLPALLWCRWRGIPIRPLFMFRSRRDAAGSFALGVGVFAVILGAWWLLRGFIDPAAIAAALSGNMGVDAENFLWVFLYVSLGNSLLEEIFFRGFAFLILREVLPEKWAALFSSTAFALYHVAMIRGFFSPILFVLVMAGLFVGGLIFILLDRCSGSVLPAWLTHMFANLAINTVGCVVLGILTY